jgi:WD40 repeat protein
VQCAGRNTEEDYVCCLLYCDGTVWCGSSDGSISVFNANTTKFIGQLLGHTGAVNCMVNRHVAENIVHAKIGRIRALYLDRIRR